MQTTLPFISVVIPIYNIEPYLERCVCSVQNQSYKNLEIILVNDGSTDNCPAICDEYAFKDNRISVIHQENMGLSAARNMGIKNASGVYIWFVDSDDYIVENAVEILVAEIRNGDCDLLLFEGDVVFESLEMQGVLSKEMYHRKESYSELVGKDCLLRQYTNGDYFCSACIYICRLDFLNEAKIQFKKGVFFEDVLFTLKAYLFAKKVRTIHNKLYMRSVRNGSIMRSESSVKKFLSLIDTSYELDLLKEHEDYSKVKAIIARNADDILHWGLAMGIELFMNTKTRLDDLQSSIKKYQIPLPSFRLNDKKDIIYYGGGSMCKLMLSAIPERPRVIWDRNADIIGEIYGVDCVTPQFGTDINSVIVICIADRRIYRDLEKQLRDSGYEDICSYDEYFWLVQSTEKKMRTERNK